MKKWLAKIVRIVTLSLLALALVATPVLAAAFTAPLTVTETSGTAYTMLPIIANAPITWMVNNGYVDADAQDTRVQTTGTVNKPHLVTDEKILTAIPVPASSQTNLVFSTGNATPYSQYIISGYGGYITTPDDADLELVNNFQVEQDGYINTDAVTAAALQAVGVTSEAASGNITPALPVGWAVNDIWLCLIASLDNINSTLPAGWTAIDAGTNNGAALRTTLYWKRAATGDTAPLITHAAGAGISAVIIGYSGIDLLSTPYDVSQATYVKTPLSVVNNFGAGVTTTVNNDIIVLLSGTAEQATSSTYTGFPTPTERNDTPNIATRPELIIADFTLAAASATQARTSTLSVGRLNNGYQVALTPQSKNLVSKSNAFRTYVSADGAITSEVTPIITVTGGNDVVDQVNHTVNMPTGVVSGDLLIVFFASHDVDVVAFPGGWTNLFDSATGGQHRFVAYYRVSDGSEGASITVTTAGNEMSAHTSYRITGYTGVPEVGAVTDANSNIPDPPNLAPTWGAASDLWFASCGYNTNATVTVYPTASGYLYGRNDYANAGGGVGVGTAYKVLNSANDNPGTFTISGAAFWLANTVAVRFNTTSVTATGIADGEAAVTTRGVANSPVWATGDVLHFDGTANSTINCGAIYNASAKLWVDFWFKLDANWTPGLGSMQVWGKFAAGTDYIQLFFNNLGQLQFYKHAGGAQAFSIQTVATSWTAGQWYHIIASISDVNAVRLRIDNGAAVTNADVSAICNGGDFVIGNFDSPGVDPGFEGQIMNFITGDDDLTVGEETDLYAGIAPGDETDYWYIDEGAGTAIYSYGTVRNLGTAGVATAWATSTYTTGNTGRLCDYTIQTVIGATTHRWGENLRGTSVADNANTWYLMDNSKAQFFPYADYYKHTATGALRVTYQPDDIIVDAGATGTLPDLTAPTENGTITWGSNPTGVDAVLSSMVSSGQPSLSTPIDEPARDIMPEIETSDWFIEPAVGGALLTNPVRPFVTFISDNTTLTELQTWRWMGIIFVLLVMAITVKVVPKHLAIACFAGGGATVFMVVETIFPLWTLVLLVLYALGGWISERSPSL